VPLSKKHCCTVTLGLQIYTSLFWRIAVANGFLVFVSQIAFGCTALQVRLCEAALQKALDLVLHRS
jgi:hypothetical protein